MFCPGREATFFDRLRVYGQPMLRVLRISTVGGCLMSHRNVGPGFVELPVRSRETKAPEILRDRNLDSDGGAQWLRLNET